MAPIYDQTLVGKRIKLLAMPEDPHPIPAGTTGTVVDVVVYDDWSQITVDWDLPDVDPKDPDKPRRKRNLMLAVPGDEFEVLP